MMTPPGPPPARRCISRRESVRAGGHHAPHTCCRNIRELLANVVIQNHAGVSGGTAPQAPAAPENEGGKSLVVYYSATGSTEAVAGYIANATGGDTFAITPAEPYSSADLNWTFSY